MARKLPRLKKHVWLTLLAILAIVLIGNVIYVTVYSRTAYSISHEEETSNQFPSSFDGFSIALITDVHLNKPTDEVRFQEMLEKLNEQKVDMVLFGGDLYSSKIFEPARVMKDLKAVQAPYGKFAVLGDEDQRNKTQVTSILNDGGFEVLNNQERPIYYKERKITLYGMNINASNQKIRSSGYSIVLTHYPDSFAKYASMCNLQLSGHSGGGYIVLPILGGLIKHSHATHYIHGTYHRKNATLIISNGVAPEKETPYKFNAGNEIKIVTLRYGQN